MKMLTCVTSISIVIMFAILWLDYADVVIADRAERLPPIQIPIWDSREYRGIKLSNGLQAMLISDPRSRKAAAAMVVAVGSMNDDKDQPGIANLVRYLLLAACRKHPKKYEFKEYVKKRGCELRPAELVTAESEHQHHFVFEVDQKFLEPTLRRFAQHFIEPLFEGIDDAALKEVLGNLSKEHDRVMSTDTMRIAQVLKSISEKDHPYSYLSYGTVNMLKRYAGLDRQSLDDKLMNFVKKWYSANLMRLVVIADEKLDVLEEMVTTSFAGIANTGVEKLIFSPEQHPWKSDQLKHKLCIVPAKRAVRQIRLSFPTPNVLSQYKISPEKYAIQFINHRGAGTLGYVLPSRGLCKPQSIQAAYHMYAGIGFFTIVMEPTEEGLKQVDSILELTFQYIRLMKNEGVNEWFYNEEKIIEESKPRIAGERINLLQSLASTMHDIPIEDTVIYNNSERGPWNAEPVLELLSYLRPDNVNISVIDQSCERAADMKTEPWYKTKYQIERISDETVNKWGSPTVFFPDLKVPSPNEFMPRSPDTDTTDLEHQLTPHYEPYLINASSISRIWHRRDDSIPVIQTAFDVMSPIMNSNPLSEIFMEVLIRILKTSLDEYEYSAQRTGHHFDIAVIPVGFQIRLTGPPGTLAILLEKILFKISHFKNLFSEENIEKSKTETLRNLKDLAESRKSFLFLIYRYILISGGWTLANLTSLPLQNVMQRQKVEKFLTKFLSRIHIQGLIFGNCSELKAIEIANSIEETFKQTSRSMLPQEMLNLFERTVQIKSGKNFVYHAFGNESKNFYHVFFAFGTANTSKRTIRLAMTSKLFQKVMNEMCSKILPPREMGTSECRTDAFKETSGFGIIITSQMHPRFLDMRAERFLEIAWDNLLELSDDELESHKSHLVVSKLMQTDHRGDRFEFYLNEIRSRTYDFKKRSTELDKLDSLKKKDLIAFYKEILAKTSPTRRKVAVYMYSNALLRMARRLNISADEMDPSKDDKLQSTIIEDIVAFKNSSVLLPSPLSKMNLVPER